MNGSNGNIASLLERIAKANEETRDSMNEMRGEMKAGFAAVNARLDTSNARLDNLLVFTGKSHADLAKRVTALERKVFKKSG